MQPTMRRRIWVAVLRDYREIVLRLVAQALAPTAKRRAMALDVRRIFE